VFDRPKAFLWVIGSDAAAWKDAEKQTELSPTAWYIFATSLCRHWSFLWRYSLLCPFLYTASVLHFLSRFRCPWQKTHCIYWWRAKLETSWLKSTASVCLTEKWIWKKRDTEILKASTDLLSVSNQQTSYWAVNRTNRYSESLNKLTLCLKAV